MSGVVEREQRLAAVNSALGDLGRRLANGEIEPGEYRRLRRALVAEATGDRELPTEAPTGRHPAISTDSRIWTRWLPLALIAAGVLILLVLGLR